MIKYNDLQQLQLLTVWSVKNYSRQRNMWTVLWTVRHDRNGWTDRVRQGTVATSKINADFGVDSNIDVTIRTVVTVTDALQEVTTSRHLVWSNVVRKWTIGYLTRATQKPGW